jgi:hypothetical protein
MDEILRHPIWKLESDDAEEVLAGEFCLRYMLSVITDRTLYLGQCDCPMARQLAMPVIGFEAEMPCVFCGKPVDLAPVPRVRDGRWVLATAAAPAWDTDAILEPDDEAPF